jgi:hypothetical protein
VSPLELVDDRFEQLARELRASRPVASEQLRHRVSVLAHVEREEPRERVFRPRIAWGSSAKRAALVLVAAAVAVPLVGAGVQGLHDSLSSKPPTVVAGKNPTPALQSGGTGSQSFGAQSGSAHQDALGERTLAPTPARLQQYDATLRLRVKDVDGLSNATKRAMTITRSFGGYVSSVGYSSRGGQRGGATLVLRVPIGNVQDALQQLTALGTILGQQTGILDVTKRAAREERQLAKLEAELSRIENELASPGLNPTRRAQLERQAASDRLALKTLTAKHRRLLRSAHLARIVLTLTTPAKHAAATPGRFERTLDDAGSVLVREFEILLYALVVVGPLLAIGAAGIAFGRAQRRRTDRRLLERS